MGPKDPPLPPLPESGNAEGIRVGEVVLLPSDDAQARRQKLARIVLDGMYQFVGLLDAQGHILEINHTALEGAGLKIEDIRGLPFWEARWWSVSRETREAQRQHVERAARGEFVRCDMEIFGSAFGHETIIIDYSLLPVRDAQGRVVFLLAEGRNITAKTRAQAELARKNEELAGLLQRVRELDRLKTDFFANLSHDLRTPLTLIIGTVENLLEQIRGGNTDDLERSIEIVRRNAMDQLRIVNDLLDIARSDSGRLPLHYQRVDAASVVRQIVSRFEAEARRRDITLVQDVPTQLPAELDVSKFERVLQNLLSNAFKFSPDGGLVRCALAAVPQNRLLLTVRDSGPGIPLAERHLIFERFRQGELGRQTADAGTGLGLAIVKEFVALHGGTVSVSDAPGRGAQFDVELPRFAPSGAGIGASPLKASFPLPASPTIPSSPLLHRPSGDAGGNGTVLVVDDHDELRGFICDVLRPHHRIVSARGVSEALRVAQQEQPDVIVTDLMMPEGGGEALVKAIRADAHLAPTPVLIVSARADDSLRAVLLSHWVQDYVTKPFSPNELRARVQNLLSIKRVRESLQRALSSSSLDIEHLTQALIDHRRALQRSVDALQRSQRRWRSLFEHSPAGIVIVDRRGRIVVRNQAFDRMLGSPASLRRGLPLAELLGGDEAHDLTERIRWIVDGGQPQPLGTLRLQHASGERVEAEAGMAVLPVTGDLGPFVAIVAVDITRRLKAERSLAYLQERMARNSRASTLGLMAAAIAHEVSQPLTAILASAQASRRWLAAQPPDVEQARRACQRIVDDTHRARAVVDRTRATIRDDGGRSEEFPLKELLLDTVELCRDTASSIGVEVELFVAPDAGIVRVDRGLLQQVLLNLLLNAFEACREVAPSRRRVHLAARRADTDFALVTVRDQGKGIAPEWRELIFEAFHTDKPHGMGIGLALSRAFVERFGGRLWVEANPDHGETFAFTLPLAGTPPQPDSSHDTLAC
jgi:PAS domain S-box-containing protein